MENEFAVLAVWKYSKNENQLLKNLQKIDDQLLELASKYKVELRKLLSHVSKYELKW